MVSYWGHQKRRHYPDPIAKNPISGQDPGSTWLKRDVSPLMIQVWPWSIVSSVAWIGYHISLGDTVLTTFEDPTLFENL